MITSCLECCRAPKSYETNHSSCYVRVNGWCNGWWSKGLPQRTASRRDKHWAALAIMVVPTNLDDIWYSWQETDQPTTGSQFKVQAFYKFGIPAYSPWHTASLGLVHMRTWQQPNLVAPLPSTPLHGAPFNPSLRTTQPLEVMGSFAERRGGDETRGAERKGQRWGKLTAASL